MSSTRSDNDSKDAGGAPTVSNSRASIDFRDPPTRATVGMGSEGYVAYPTGSGGGTVPTTLRFPTGTVRRDFFQINIGTNYAFALDKDPRHQPTDFEFFSKAAGLDQAQTQLREDAEALGLSEEKIKDITAQGTSVEQGYVRGELSTEVEVRDTGSGDGSLNIIYTVAIGAYHNEALDKILRDGKIDVDLTSRPTPADLGFRPTYDTAMVNPEPKQQLEVTLRTPTGSTTLPTDSLISEGRDGRADVTVLLGSAKLDEAPDVLRSAAPALGFDLPASLAMVQGAGQALTKRDVTCASTDVYTCALRLQTVDTTGAENSFSYRVTLTYR